jgi:integrase
MRGHVLRRGKSWSWIVDVGRDPATGKRRQEMKGGFPTRRDAERALAHVVSDLDTGTHVTRDPETVGEWIDRWLPTMAAKVRPSTYRDYGHCLERVVARFGHVRLQELTPLQIEEFYASLLRSGHRRGGPLAPKTVRNVHIALRRSLADAVRFGLVPRNVAALVKAPTAERSEMATWTADEVRHFLDHVAGDRLAPVYRLIITTGMRRGEALGLRWSDVDLAGARLSVNRSLTTLGGKPAWSLPKTARSRRQVSLDPDTVEILRAHRVRQLEERLAAGEAWQDDDLVFCNEDGTVLHPDHVTKAFRRRAREAGLSVLRLHDLRHTWATLALQAGVHPKVVSDRLGHATSSITLDLYSHVQPALDAEAATTVAALFSAQPR